MAMPAPTPPSAVIAVSREWVREDDGDRGDDDGDDRPVDQLARRGRGAARRRAPSQSAPQISSGEDEEGVAQVAGHPAVLQRRGQAGARGASEAGERRRRTRPRCAAGAARRRRGRRGCGRGRGRGGRRAAKVSEAEEERRAEAVPEREVAVHRRAGDRERPSARPAARSGPGTSPQSEAEGGEDHRAEREAPGGVGRAVLGRCGGGPKKGRSATMPAQATISALAAMAAAVTARARRRGRSPRRSAPCR